MKKADALTMNEFRQLRDAFKKEAINGSKRDVRNRAVIELLFTMTLRVSDLLDLKVRDVTKPNGDIKDAIMANESKNDNMKGVFIRPKPKRALTMWIDRAELTRGDYLFPSPYTEGHITRQTVDNIIKSKLGEIDLEEEKVVSTHSGRKTMGRRLRENGVGIQEIREILGHEDESTTRKYIGIFNKDLKKSVMSLPD